MLTGERWKFPCEISDVLFACKERGQINKWDNEKENSKKEEQMANPDYFKENKQILDSDSIKSAQQETIGKVQGELQLDLMELQWFLPTSAEHGLH